MEWRRKVPMARLVSAIVCTSLLVAIGSVSAEPFTVECHLPFENIKKHHPIDDNCAARGAAEANDSPEGLQNLAKNNFCAATPTLGPALVTFISFKKLQQKLDQKAPGRNTGTHSTCRQTAAFWSA